MVPPISIRSCPRIPNFSLALPETANYTSDDEIKNLRGECEAEAPTKHLYEFYGNIEVKDNSHSMRDDGQRIPVDAAQVIFYQKIEIFRDIFTDVWYTLCTDVYFVHQCVIWIGQNYPKIWLINILVFYRIPVSKIF